MVNCGAMDEVMGEMRKRAVLDGLRQQLQHLERGAVSAHPSVSKSFFLVEEGPDPAQLSPAPPAIEKGALHEIRGHEHRDRPAAFGFLLALVARSWQSFDARPVLWCEEASSTLDFGGLYGPGLKAFGLPPERFIVVRTQNTQELLWAMEEGVRSASLSAIVGAFSEAKKDLDLTASRRLQLAAESTGTTAFLLRQPTDCLASVARTRWVIEARPSGQDVRDTIIGRPRWQVTLDKSRAGRPGTWTMEWNYASHCFYLVSALADRPVLPEHGLGGEPDRGAVVELGPGRGRKGRSAA